MRIGILCGAGFVSGKEIIALELGEGLRNIGFEVQFLTSRWGNGDFAHRAEHLGFPTYRTWLGYVSATLTWPQIKMTLDQLRRWPQLAVTYLNFLKRFQPEKVIHTNWHHALLLLPFLKSRRDVYWVHEVMPYKPQYRWLFRRLSSRIGCFVAVSRAAATALVKLGVAANHVVMVPNGISDPTVGRTKSSPNGFAIGIVGQVGAWKGHEDLLDAFHLLLPRYPEAQLHIFGKGDPQYETFLRLRIESLELTSHVNWHGFVKDRSRIYDALSVLVAPSRFEEPFGLTAVEAACFALPVIASARGGLSEIVQDQVTGLLFEAGNSSELAECLATLLGDPELRDRMGRQARHRALSLFGQSEFVRRFSELLQLKLA